MNKSLITTVLVIILLGISYYFFTKFRSPVLSPELSQPPTPPVYEVAPTATSTITPTTSSTTTLKVASTSTKASIPEVVITITTNGFNPKEIEITKGTKVTWINKQSNPSWPASAVHPTHEVYPGSSIKKCGTSEEDKIFDACRGLQQGEKWSFIFNEVGEWYYHDHLNPSWKGEIEVK
jgi:plastocyanin